MRTMVELLSDSIELTPVPMVVHELSGRFVIANKLGARSMGIELSGIRMHNVYDFFIDPAYEQCVHENAAMEMGDVSRCKVLLTKKQGMIQIVDCTIVTNNVGGTALTILCFVDVLKPMEIDSQLRQIAGRDDCDDDLMGEKQIAFREVSDFYSSHLQKSIERVKSDSIKLLNGVIKRIEEMDAHGSGKLDELHSLSEVVMQTKGRDICKLTRRELSVARLIKQGKSSKEIASELYVSVETIKKHRMSIRKKFDLLNKKLNLEQFLRSMELSSGSNSRLIDTF
ncbi:MAG: helix-turn-helix transcriptional regulator [bacterium]|nr:helix-turn-helix transcriptional regulator [bacterium]